MGLDLLLFWNAKGVCVLLFFQNTKRTETEKNSVQALYDIYLRLFWSCRGGVGLFSDGDAHNSSNVNKIPDTQIIWNIYKRWGSYWYTKTAYGHLYQISKSLIT